MWALVQQDTVVRTFTESSNIRGHNYTHSDVRLIDRLTRLSDGIFDLIDATYDETTHVKTGETFVIDNRAGTATRVLTLVPKTTEQLNTETQQREKHLASQQLANSDLGMGRVAEDLINALIKKGVLTNADLPANVITKITERANLRVKIKG